MGANPFDILDAKLSKLELLLTDLLNKENKNNSESESIGFVPVNEIISKGFFSKPTFYLHVREGRIKLYKLGNKSFVHKKEFESAFRHVNLK